jgi:hypothetical protein
MSDLRPKSFREASKRTISYLSDGNFLEVPWFCDDWPFLLVLPVILLNMAWTFCVIWAFWVVVALPFAVVGDVFNINEDNWAYLFGLTAMAYIVVSMGTALAWDLLKTGFTWAKGNPGAAIALLMSLLILGMRVRNNG